MVSLRPGHLGQQGPAPSATRMEILSHHRNCTATGSVVVTAAGPGPGLPGEGGPCLLPRLQLSPAPPGTLIITQRQKEYVYLGHTATSKTPSPYTAQQKGPEVALETEGSRGASAGEDRQTG